ncbi:MAG: hypothetical protein LKK13_03655 [Bacilli bacterium]|jgi:hypothetical protein|nr:hypothetical protein [Bacilli bacterium]
MRKLLDIEKETEYWGARRRAGIWLMVFVSLAYLTLLTLCLFLSGEEYLAEMWVCVGVGVAYVWWLLYFLTVPFRERNKRFRFFLSAETGLRETSLVSVIGQGEPVEKEGIDMIPLKTSFSEGNRTFERDFYLMGGSVRLLPGSKVRIESFSNVVLAIEDDPHE